MINNKTLQTTLLRRTIRYDVDARSWFLTAVLASGKPASIRPLLRIREFRALIWLLTSGFWLLFPANNIILAAIAIIGLSVWIFLGILQTRALEEIAESFVEESGIEQDPDQPSLYKLCKQLSIRYNLPSMVDILEKLDDLQLRFAFCGIILIPFLIPTGLPLVLKVLSYFLLLVIFRYVSKSPLLMRLYLP